MHFQITPKGKITLGYLRKLLIYVCKAILIDPSFLVWSETEQKVVNAARKKVKPEDAYS